MPLIRTLLIANRGEIALRIIRSCRRLGIATVAVYSDADRGAPHVQAADHAMHIGPAPAAESYLHAGRLIAAALAAGADAVHPGYGFLSEQAAFARQCEAAGLIFVGPSADSIEAMGSKIRAKELALAAGVPVVPGFQEADASDSRLAAEGSRIGFPLLIKASAGGGGKGMRIVRQAAELPDALAAARREALAAFGDGSLLLERYFEQVRHVEIQILGDRHGQVLHLFERECSIQRRHQKIVEESPSPGLSDALRTEMAAAAVRLARSIGYYNAGTVEFILTPEGQFYFLEVNTRLQVEHPVTELVTGLDLVALQIAVAEGRPLPLRQEEIRQTGHAVECRLYAEDPARGFLPDTGVIRHWAAPPDLPARIDAGVETGTEVTVHYDPMLAKLIASGPDRPSAVRSLRRSLDALAVLGLRHNRDLLIRILDHPAFGAGETYTDFVQRHAAGLEPAAQDPEWALTAAALWLEGQRREDAVFAASLPSGWRNNPYRPQIEAFELDGGRREVRYRAAEGGRYTVSCGTQTREVQVLGRTADSITLEWDGRRRRVSLAAWDAHLHLHTPGEPLVRLERSPRFPAAAASGSPGDCRAPMPGRIVRMLTAAGAGVQAGDPLLVLSSMKMENTLYAPMAGRVTDVLTAEGAFVEAQALLLHIEPA
ncbi:MAG: biotin carboxylase N-terminal domain-containing protein [Bacteroidia bacterium]|nr:biotin carboxylase N-terminal domain-containing protein [Bacteroidia bacterium]